MARRKITELRVFTVEGTGEFPFDMLRYDMCWPYRGEDAAQMSGHTAQKRRRVVVQHFDTHPITEARWRSFNWQVIGEGVHESDKPRDDGTWIEPGHEPGA